MDDITVNGKPIKLRKLRTSAKGATVFGARLHIPGSGTLYLQMYEDNRPAPIPKASKRELISLVQTLSERLERLESSIMVGDVPPSPFLPPPPTH